MTVRFDVFRVFCIFSYKNVLLRAAYERRRLRYCRSNPFAHYKEHPDGNHVLPMEHALRVPFFVSLYLIIIPRMAQYGKNFSKNDSLIQQIKKIIWKPILWRCVWKTHAHLERDKDTQNCCKSGIMLYDEKKGWRSTNLRGYSSYRLQRWESLSSERVKTSALSRWKDLRRTWYLNDWFLWYSCVWINRTRNTLISCSFFIFSIILQFVL